MYIYPVTCNKMNFQANERFIADKSGHLAYKTTTYFFREDTNWDKLFTYLNQKYKNTDKINVISHACSNGMEPYSFIMYLKSFYPQLVEKYTPITAKDLNAENILMAKRANYNIDNIELYNLDYYTNGKYRDFFNYRPTYEIGKSIGLSLKDDCKKLVNIEQGDIFQDIEKMPRENTVLFCKNFWPYLTQEKREILAQKLGKKFDHTSIIITGDYDYNKCNISTLMKKNGFYPHPTIENVWEKLK